ncbi:MAG: hypothetical protein II821_03425 [Treponema sp.]|nr:hypothetical protein [Treponema sp.]
MIKRNSVRDVIVSGMLILMTATMLAGCNKKKTVETVVTENKESVSSNSITNKTRILQSQIVLYGDNEGHNTPLYKEDSNGNMILAAEAIPGDEIDVYESLESSLEFEVRNAARLLSNGNGEMLDFVHVRYYDKEYWTLPVYITNLEDLKAAVVTEDTLIYSSTDLDKAKTYEVEKGTFVAGDRYKTVEGISYMCVFYYDWTTPYGKKGYIKKDMLKDQKKDVLAAQVERKFAQTKNLDSFVRDEVTELLQDYTEL